MTKLDLDAIVAETQEMRGRKETVRRSLMWRSGMPICGPCYSIRTDLPRACDIITALVERVRELEGRDEHT